MSLSIGPSRACSLVSTPLATIRSSRGSGIARNEKRNKLSPFGSRTRSLAPYRGYCSKSKDLIFENASAPKSFRYPISWRDPDYYDEKLLEHEVRRVFDICHGCRLCYSLCDSFPRLFDLIDESATGELDSVPSSEFKKVADACTLCDICFMNKCPYTPPHGLNVDFPHLMLRMKALDNAASNKQNTILETPTKFASAKESSGMKMEGGGGNFLGVGGVHVKEGVSRKLETQKESFVHSIYSHMDLIAPLASATAPIANWMTKIGKSSKIHFLIRSAMERVLGIHPSAELPSFVSPSETLVNRSKKNPYKVDKSKKAFSENRKVIVYATCNGNYNKPNAANAFRAILSMHGVKSQVEYDGCCGMPQLESGKLKEVSSKASTIASKLRKWVDEGYDVVTPVTSCSLMLKKEWHLLEPLNEDIKVLSEKTYDMSEYLVKLQKEGILEPIPALDGSSVTLHHACHARAQNMGFKSQQLLETVPKLSISSIERCSGHGGTFGVQSEGHKLAMKVGKPVFNKTLNNALDSPVNTHYISSDCPLAMDHIVQGVQETAIEKEKKIEKSPIAKHPVEIVAMAYDIKL